MDRPSTSQHEHSIDKVEMFEVREHVPYQVELTRAPVAYDEESSDTTKWSSAWNAICQLINLFQHLMIAIVVFNVWYFALTSAPSGGITNLQLHIIFAGTGYQLFLVQAILTMHRHNSWSFQLSMDSKRIVHGCLQFAGAVFVVAGTCLGLAEAEMQINTAHGICGVIALIFTILSFFTGITALFSAKVRLVVRNGPIKILHLGVGVAAVSMGLVTLAMGFKSDYYSSTQGSLSSAMMTFVIIILAYVLGQPLIDLVSSAKKSM